jgi:fructan beta-fructosidase
MNDPNGLVYFQGEYHLFYQYYPDSTVWGPMHWGHAISNDLVRWDHQPIALYPDSLGFIFSGSAVIDHKNTSGLGTDQAPAMVAIYTYHLMEGEKAGRHDFQTQGLAYSLDRGRTWTKYSGNPVLPNPGKHDFRDPKVIWHDASKKWVMILAVKDHVELFGSTNLIDWKYLSSFGEATGAHGGVWECPDLFELNVAGTNDSKWMMLVSINPGAPNGGSGTQYFIGHFDGNVFQSETTETLWLDYGKDNYAGVTWSNIPAEDGRRLFVGWMSNWQYAQVVPTHPWRSAMTLPRELALKRTPPGLRLASTPIHELNSLIQAPETLTPVLPTGSSSSSEYPLPAGALLEFTVQRTDTREDVELELFNAQGERVLIGLTGAVNQFFVDRTQSGKTDFSTDFPGKHVAPRAMATKDVTVRIWVDASSVEVFADDGTIAMTELYFSTQPLDRFRLRGSVGTQVDSVRVSALRSIWTK